MLEIILIALVALVLGKITMDLFNAILQFMLDILAWFITLLIVASIIGVLVAIVFMVL